MRLCRVIPFFLIIYAVFSPLVFDPQALSASDVYLKLAAQGSRVDIGVAGFAVVFSSGPERKKMDGSSILDFQNARQINSIIRDDLVFTRMFNIVEGGPLFTGRKEELDYWSRLNTDIIFCGEYRAGAGVKGTDIEIVARLLDVESGGAEIWSSVFKYESGGNIRRIAHRISDEVILRLTGERGIASTKIVFSNDSTGNKEIYTIDYDGKGLVRLTNERSIAILPRFSPDGKEIIYTTYRFGNPDLYAIDTRTLARRAVSTVQGLNTAAVFSPDSENILLTQSRGGSPNLYLISRRDGTLIKRLTNFRAGIDTSPSFSPTGDQIAFISNRAGYPQVYIMNSDGGNIRRISAPGNCDSPAWSPRGDRIAFSQFTALDGKYDIYVYEIARGKISRLTFQDDGNNENPTWSPDGRYIAFISTRNGKRELFRMFGDGSSPARIADIPGRCFTPHWSPRLAED